MMRKLETRLMPTRSTTTTSDNSVTGIAVPYGQLSHPIQGAGRSFREKVKPGALTYDENTVREVLEECQALCDTLTACVSID